jgi:hypothetical protein
MQCRFGLEIITVCSGCAWIGLDQSGGGWCLVSFSDSCSTILCMLWL